MTISRAKPTWLVVTWIYILGILLFLLGVAGFIKFVSGGDDTTEAGGLDPALLLQLQTACFQSNLPLFYDDQGFCYSVDPATLS